MVGLAKASPTIPRLELLGVVIGVRALKFVENQLHLPVMSKILYTDSQCVLHWMQTAKPLPVLITNRLKEIKECEGISFNYVPSKENPADIATRGQSLSELTSSIWWTGPQWLLQHKQQWPDWKVPEANLSIQDLYAESNKHTLTDIVVGEGSHKEK